MFHKINPKSFVFNFWGSLQSDASPYYIRMRMRGITMLYPAFGDMIYISIVHFLALLQTIPQLRWGIV